jgi:small-conductance mechanosensitive channel
MPEGRLPPPPGRMAPLLALLVALLLLLATPAAQRAQAAPGQGPTPLPGAQTAPAPAAQVSPEPPPSSWVTLEGRPILEIRSAAGTQKPEALALQLSRQIKTLVDNPTIQPERIEVREDPPYSMVGVVGPDGRFHPGLAVDDRAARAFRTSRQALAESYRDDLRGAIRQYRSTHTLGSWLRGTALSLLVLGVYLLWLRVQLALNRRLFHWISAHGAPWVARLRLSGSRLLDDNQSRSLLQFLRRAVNAALLLLISYLLIPLQLGFFPPTQVVAEGLRGQIARVVGGLMDATVNAIPNLLIIALILAITAMVIRASNAWFRAIGNGQLQFPGFYPEWALPTQRIAATLILLAGLVSAYPYVPGSGSRVFQGAGLFVGVLAALGSSAVASNVISGLMLIYTRAFREGDRVEINGVIGVVQDRDLLVTRVQTPRNELVSIPNATVIASSIINFSFSRREIQRPVAIASTVTIGYDVPWRQVHALLLRAASRVSGLSDDPAPFVLQTSLNDFHISYELNAYVRNVVTYRETLSEMLAAVQDCFAEADVEILSPGYHAIRDGNRSTVPKPPVP